MQNSQRKAYSSKLQLQDDHKIALLTAKEIADLTKTSLSHTYRIVKDPEKNLTPTAKELLIIKALGQIPSWKTGWRFDARNQQIITPDGKILHCNDLENYALARRALSHNQKLTDCNEKRTTDLEAHKAALRIAHGIRITA